MNTSKHRVDGTALSPKTGEMKKVESLVKETKRGRPRTKQPLFPSPKDMLTGALPSKGRESPYDTTHLAHLSQPDSYLSGVHSLSGKSQSKTPRREVQHYRRQSFAQDIDSDDQNLSPWPEISSLEKDPAAFIAAAGLNMLSAGIGLQDPHETSSRSTVNHHLGVSSTWPTASTIPATAFAQGVNAYDADFDKSPPQHVTVQPQMLVYDLNEPDSRERAPFASQEPPMASHENYWPVHPSSQVSITATKGKGRGTVSPSDIYTSANRIIGVGSDIVMTEPTKPMREMIVSDWVKKQKLAKTKLANLKGRGRNKKSLVVVLKVGREGWKKWEEQKVEPDLITKELVLGGGKVHKVLVGKAGSGDVADGVRSVSVAASASVGEYASGSVTGSLETKKRGRGRPRKNPKPEIIDVDQENEQDDDEEPEVIPQPKTRKRESAWMIRKREEEAKEEAANAIENEKRAREKAIEDEEMVRLKAIEDEKRRIEEERRRREDEKKAIEEEKRRDEERRLQAIQDEKDRKEAERRRAYQEAKRMAAKMAEGQFDGAWEYDSEEYEQDRYSEEVEVWEEEEAWWESKLPGSHFAVAIERRPGYHWKTQYMTEAKLALRTGEPDEPNMPTSTLEVKAQTSKQLAASSPGERRLMAAAAGDISPVTRSRRKSAGEMTRTKMIRAQKSIDSNLDSDGEYTASKWSLRKKKMQVAQTVEIDKPMETIKGGLRRSTITKYLGPGESFEHNRDPDGNVEAEIGDGKDMDEMDVESEDMETEEGYDDRWKRGGRKWMW